jgi:hypothetical protein
MKWIKFWIEQVIFATCISKNDHAYAPYLFLLTFFSNSVLSCLKVF